MTRKLRHTRKKFERINLVLKTKPQINNRKLAKLVHDYWIVQLELTEMNNFFKYNNFFCGLTFLHTLLNF